MGSARISVIISCLNEEKRIHKALDAIGLYIQSHPESILEVIVVNDGSSDATATAALAYRDKLPNLKLIELSQNHGKGYGMRTGVLASQGEWVLLIDADNSTPIETELDKLLPYTDSYDIILGSRYVKDSTVLVKQSVKRIILSRAINLGIKMLAVSGVNDTQCGFKLIRGVIAKELFAKQKIERWLFDVELLSLAQMKGYKIKEVGILWINDTDSRIRAFRDGYRTIRDLLKIEFYRLTGGYR